MNDNRLPRAPWASRILFRTEVGSTAHGTGIDGHEDYDEIAVMWEPLVSLVGLHPIKDTIVYRPGRTEGQRSGPGDWDLTVYTARKWARLAASGNPSILVSMFGPRVQATYEGLDVLSHAEWFWSDLARQRFLGYARAQRKRLLGVRGGRHTNRPELTESHGYDTKYAMHMLRLGYQGIEYMLTGRLVLPMEDERGDYLRSVRQGEKPLDEVVDLAASLEAQLIGLEDEAPPEPKYAEIDRWLVRLSSLG